MKNSLIIAAMLSALTAGARGQSSVENCEHASPHHSSTLALLSERLDQVDFDEAPLDQVIEWLSDLTAMNVVVQWQVLEELGIERDRPITLHIHNLRFSQALWMILSEAGGPDVRLGYRAEEDLLVISSRDKLAQDMVIKVYDVADLLLNAPRFSGAPQINLTSTTGNGQSSAFDDGGSESTDESEGSDVQQTKIDQLMEIITETVEPDSWISLGGQGTIAAFDDMLIIRNTYQVHQLLGGFVE